MSDQLSILFAQALELSDWYERQAFVDEKCGEDKSLANDLMQMLRVHQKATGFLSKPPLVTPTLAELGENEKGKNSDSRIGRDSVVGRLTQEFDLGSQLVCHTDSAHTGQTESSTAEAMPRYQLHGEIARGGMGAIVKAKDVDLGRTLAIKVLLDEHRDNPSIAERFIEEAQIGGQLQHPGITPVYELGAMPDKRPFFSMKLVKGQTLAALLKERKNLADQRSRLLGVFEQVCQTVAYAHSRRVIHRDLKPANIMVGAFGEVQVMDWGLAKVLKTGGIADEKRARDTKLGQSIIRTVRSDSNHPQASIGTHKSGGSAGSETHAGSVMGTPAYMPPEQALGEVERLDARCDVFGLGAILCEIITGQPPYVAEDQSELFRLAARGKLDECYDRLSACGADQALVEIAKASIASEVENRLRNARELSDQVTSYLESVESRLRQAEIERAAEVARVTESRKRRKIATALAASVLFMLAFAGSGLIWLQIQADSRKRAAAQQLAEAVNEAKLHRSLASSDNLTTRSNELKKAIASAERAVGLFDGGELTDEQRLPVDQLLSELNQAVRKVELELARQSKDDKLRDRLEILRLDLAGGSQELNVASELATAKSRDEATAENYTRLFLDAGIDIRRLPADEAAKLVRKSSLSSELIAGLDQWAATIKRPRAFVLIAEATIRGEWQVGIESLRQTIREGEAAGRFKAEPYIGLGAMLILSGQQDEYRALCRELVFDKPYPGGYILAERVSKTCLLLPRKEMGVSPSDLPIDSFAKSLDDGRVAPVIAAYVWATRALAAYRDNHFEECVQYTQRAEEADHSPLSGALFLAARSMGQYRLRQRDEARATFSRLQATMDEIQSSEPPKSYRTSPDALVAFLLYREARQLIESEKALLEFTEWADATTMPDRSAIQVHQFRNKLADIANQADDDAWRIQVRQALLQRDTDTLTKLADSDDISSQSPELAAWFATELRRRDRLAEAIQVLQASYENHPDDFWINYEMGRCLTRQATHEDAIGFSRAAVALRPESAGARWSLSIALAGAGQQKESNQVFDQLVVDSDVSHENYPSLVRDLYGRGHYEKAQRITEKWLAEFPNNADAHGWMCNIFKATQEFELSVEWAEKALDLDPENSLATFNRAFSLAKLERWEDAAAAYRAHLDLDPDSTPAHNNLGNVLLRLDDLDGAEAAFREALRLRPSYRLPLANLIRTLNRKLRNRRVPGLYGEIKRLTGELARAEQEEIPTYRERLQTNPRDSRTRIKLIEVLRKGGEMQEATREAEKAVAFDPDNVETHSVLGSLYQQQGELDRAIEQLRIAVKLDEDSVKIHHSLGRALAEKAIGKTLRPGFAFNGTVVPEGFDLTLTPEKKELVDEAIEHFEFLAKSDAPPFLIGPLGELLHLRGRVEEAEKFEQEMEKQVNELARETQEDRDYLTQGGLAQSSIPFSRQFNRVRFRIERLREEGQAAAAMGLIDQFRETNPEFASQPVLLSIEASLHIENGDTDKGFEIFRKMQDAGVMQGYLGQARYEREQGKWLEAEKSYQEAIKLLSDLDEDPSPKSMLYGELAEIYGLQGRLEDELRMYELILEADESPYEVLQANRGKYEIDGDQRAALERSAEWRFSGRYPPSQGFWAWLQMVEPGEDGNFGDLDMALGYARDASIRSMRGSVYSSRLSNYLRKRPECKIAYSGKNSLGMVHFRRREYPQALKALQEFYDLGFEEPGNWLFLAMTHWKLGNQPEARQWFHKATDFLDQDGYRVRHSEKLLRAEAEEMMRMKN